MLISSRARSRLRRPPAGVGGGGGGGYDLAAKLAALPFVVNTPTAPTTTSNHTVTTAAEMTTALGVAGANITVTANITGDFTANTTDQLITIQAGVTVRGAGTGGSLPAQRALTIGASARRVHIRGPGAILGSFFINSAAQDVRFDDALTITTFTNATTTDDDVVHLYGTRVLLEHVTVTSRTYADFSQQAVDKVIANCQMLSTGSAQSTVRMVGTTRGVVIDSRLLNYSHHNLRAHSFSSSVPSDYIYWARNQLETDIDENAGGGIMVNDSAGNPNPQTLNLWMVDNSIYGAMVAVDGTPENEWVTATGNRIYSDVPSSIFSFGTFSGGTVSDNTKSAWGSGPGAWNFT